MCSSIQVLVYETKRSLKSTLVIQAIKITRKRRQYLILMILIKWGVSDTLI